MMAEKTKSIDNQKTYVDKIAEKIINALEDGTAPWVKSWRGSELTGITPFNPTTNKPYNGINFVNLAIEQSVNGYADPRWLTYKQAESIGAQVRKGEHSTTIQYWKFTEQIDKVDENGNKVIGEDGRPEQEAIKLQNPKAFYSTVFNATQIDGMPELARESRPERNFEAIEAAEKIITNSGATIRHIEGNGAYYRPQADDITLPIKEQFNSEMEYYSTALHELGHWTGHKTRLDRDLNNSFGTQGYAKEELRAEIASYMLCSELGVDFDPTNHHAYIQSWVKNLHEAPNEIFKAAADAGKITQFLQGFNMELDQTVTQNQTILKDFQSLKDYTKELSAQYPNFVVTSGASSSLYSNYMMANKELTQIKHLHVTSTGQQEWENISVDIAKQRLENAYFPQLVKEWGLDKVQTQNTELEQKTPSQVFSEKTFLNVAYSEKDIAKRFGAKWDKDEKMWYAPEGIEKDKLSQFLPENKEIQALIKSIEPLNQKDILSQFKEALEKHELIIDGDPVMDGKMIRVPVAGDKGKEKSGAYIGYTDGRAAGMIQNFKTGVKDKWISHGEWQKVSPEQEAAQLAKMEQNKAQRENERKEQHENVSVKVRTDFKQAREATNEHPYLKEKGVENHGLKLDDRGNLFMPLQDVEGKIWTAQHIGVKGYKGFEPGGKKEGNFFIIGANSIEDITKVVICEGYATGATIHEAINAPVIVAVDAGNLANVAKAINEKFPDKAVIIAADNDIQKEQAGKDNVGRIKAEAAAEASKGVFIAPRFTNDEIVKGSTDFNDLGRSRGLGEVKKQLDIAIHKVQEQAQSKQKDLSEGQNKTQQRDLRRQVQRQTSMSL